MEKKILHISKESMSTAGTLGTKESKMGAEEDDYGQAEHRGHNHSLSSIATYLLHDPTLKENQRKSLSILQLLQAQTNSIRSNHLRQQLELNTPISPSSKEAFPEPIPTDNIWHWAVLVHQIQALLQLLLPAWTLQPVLCHLNLPLLLAPWEPTPYESISHPLQNNKSPSF